MLLKFQMAKKEKQMLDDRKTVLLRKDLWKELHTIKVNEEYSSISNLIEDMLKNRRKKK